MEASEAAARRLNRIAGHLNAAQQSSSCSSPLATLACSARKDNRILYARQFHPPAVYMTGNVEPQASAFGSGLQSTTARKDNRLLFSRQGSHTQAFYMRECLLPQVTCPLEESIPASLEESIPAFDIRPKAQKSTGVSLPKDSCSSKQTNYEVCQDCGLLSADGPKFARPQHNNDGHKLTSLSPIAIKDKGLEWLPRMDVAESRAAYVLTVELPGATAEGIHVEVNNDRLLISGTRTAGWWEADHGKDIHQDTIFRRKELEEGPYRVIWPIPRDIKTSSISAEFADGLLRVFIPKISIA